MKKFTISGTLPSLNEYTHSQRANKYGGGKFKKDWQRICEMYIRHDLRGLTIRTPVTIEYHFFEKNKRRDHDNVSGFAHKVIQDALVSAGYMRDDGWDYVTGYTDKFSVDAKNPRIEVTIWENVNG